MTFDEWIAAYRKAYHGQAVNLEREMRACWNAALEAAAQEFERRSQVADTVGAVQAASICLALKDPPFPP